MKSQQEECVLCCREIEIYAVGACDHHVCYECAARMRVLCETNECPICRSDVPIVVFTNKKKEFSAAERNFFAMNNKFQILFEDGKIRSAFERLLENRCKSCEEVLPDFHKLKVHVRNKHELHYCDLCTDSLKIFTFERKCYSRKDLARHKRNGDPDETSHRGHPLCEFCDHRYVDKDELFRHLRREHYFCHFCDHDGLHQYYKDYEDLKTHFRKDHYLCEEGECLHEKFVGAFRSDIDLKAHIAVNHSKNKSKQEVKQTRLLEFEFAHPARYTGGSSPRSGRYQQRRRNEDDISSRDKYKNNQQQPEKENINTQSVQDFPYLSEDSTNKEISLTTFNRNVTAAYSKGTMSAEDFPALCPAPPEKAPSKKMNYSAPVQPLQKNTKNNANSKQQPRTSEMENGDKSSSQKAGKWLKKNINFEEDFPSLEVRKKPVATIPLVPKTVKNSNTTPSWLTDTVPKPESKPVVNGSSQPAVTVEKSADGDQFVVIKSKPKKKKPNKVNNQYDLDDEEDFPGPGKEIQEDEGNNNRYRKDLVHPLLVAKPPAPPSNDYWEVKPVSFIKDDFPPLAPAEPVKNKKPPGFKNATKPKPPPPGFTDYKPPKAAHKTLSDQVREIVMGSQNGTVNSNCDTKHSYVQPPNFERRNNDLIGRINEITITERDLFKQFKVESGKYRNTQLSAAEYHSKCLEILGYTGFQEIFPELVSLLPDIEKQQELLTVHDMFLSHKSGGAISKNTPRTVTLVSCNKCNQVLTISDRNVHALSHE